MITRDWMNDAVKKQIYQINYYFNEHQINEILDILERMDTDHDVYYCENILGLVLRACQHKSIASHCSSSDSYDACHEFCLYFDGILWEVHTTDTTDYGDFKLRALETN